MQTLIKLLKIVLPLATSATATIATVFLVSFKQKDQEKKKQKEDILLNDFELETEEFKEKIIEYAEEEKTQEKGDSHEETIKEEDSKSPSSLNEIIEKAEKEFKNLVSMAAPEGEKELHLKMEKPLVAIQANNEHSEENVNLPKNGESTVSEEEEAASPSEEREAGLPIAEEGLIDNETIQDAQSEKSTESLNPSSDGEERINEAQEANQEQLALEQKTEVEVNDGSYSLNERSVGGEDEEHNSEGDSKMDEEELERLEKLKSELIGFKDSLQQLLNHF